MPSVLWQYYLLHFLHRCLHRDAGSICMQLIKRIQMGGLMESYMHKSSKFNKLLRTYPVFAVTHKNLGLLGTKEYAIRLLEVSPRAS